MDKQNWLNIIINFICKFILCYIGLYSSAIMLSIIYSIDINSVTIRFCSFLALLGFILIVQSKKTIFIGIAALIYMIFSLATKYNGFFSKILNGFNAIIRIFVYKLNSIGYSINYNISQSIDLAIDSQVAFLTIIIFLSIVITIGVYKKSHPFFVACIIISLMLPGIVFEFMPSVLNFKFVLSFIISVFVFNILDKMLNVDEIEIKNLKQSIYYTTYYGKISLIIFIFIYLSNTIFSYIPEKEEIIDLSVVENIANEISIAAEKNRGVIPTFFDIGFSGGMGNGNLGKGGFKYSNIPIMDVYTNSNTPLYLRTWIGKDYSYNRWFSFDKAEMERYLNYFGKDFMPEQITWDFFKKLSDLQILAEIMDKSVYLNDVRIEYININKDLAYIPSVSIDVQNYFESGDFINKGEGMVLLSDKFNPKLGYNIKSIMPAYSSGESIKNIITQGPIIYEMQQDVQNNIFLEREYRNFVYSTYIYLPTDIFEPISTLAKSVTENEATPYEKTIAVQQYLSQNYTYNLNPPQNDSNEDFVKYFLFESKEGYCTYYATAMVLMLRTLGIPARYVEGYLVQGEGEKVKDQIKRTVLDSNAHAWPEVYFDGVGWLPFEPTVVYTSEVFEQNNEYENTNNISEYEEPIVESAESIQQTEASVEPTTVEPEQVKEKELQVPLSNNFKNFLNISIIILIIIMYLIITNINKRKYNYKNMDSEQLIKYIFEQLERIKLKLNNSELPTEFAKRVDTQISYHTTIKFADITNIILKLRFSNNSINYNEMDLLKSYARDLTKILYFRANIFQKVYYKYFLFIV